MFCDKRVDSKSSQLESFHFLCWKKNKKRLHNWDSKQGTSKTCSLFNTERRKYELPTTTKRVCFHVVSFLEAVQKAGVRGNIISHFWDRSHTQSQLSYFWHFSIEKCSSDTNSFTSGSMGLSKGYSQTPALPQVKRFQYALALFEIATYFLVGIAYHHRACSALSEQFSFLFICG